MKREVIPARPRLLVQSWWFWCVVGFLYGAIVRITIGAFS